MRSPNGEAPCPPTSIVARNAVRFSSTSSTWPSMRRLDCVAPSAAAKPFSTSRRSSSRRLPRKARAPGLLASARGSLPSHRCRLGTRRHRATRCPPSCRRHRRLSPASTRTHHLLRTRLQRLRLGRLLRSGRLVARGCVGIVISHPGIEVNHQFRITGLRSGGSRPATIRRLVIYCLHLLRSSCNFSCNAGNEASSCCALKLNSLQTLHTFF
jgi:hypothetical protein